MGFLRLFSVGLVAPTALTGLLAGPMALSALADTVLQEAGTIYPAESTYSFDGKAGQAITITLDSEEFDPVLSLADGTYTVVAKSFSGLGGDYDLVVRTSTEFEMTYAEAEALILVEDYPGAIVAYTKAIEIDPTQPAAYLGRAQAILGEVYVAEGDAVQGPGDIPPEARERVIADFEQAATLFEESGSPDWAASLREQAEVLRSVDSGT